MHFGKALHDCQSNSYSAAFAITGLEHVEDRREPIGGNAAASLRDTALSGLICAGGLGARCADVPGGYSDDLASRVTSRHARNGRSDS